MHGGCPLTKRDKPDYEEIKKYLSPGHVEKREKKEGK